MTPANPSSPPTRRNILGLLGGIASGKSTVAAILAEGGRGVVVDADALAKLSLEEGARDGRLVATLGPWAVTKGGAPDRKAIAKRVFDDPKLLRSLERLTHPSVLAKINDAIEEHRAGRGAPLLILDVPLLIEVGLERRCDALWFVAGSDADRFARAEQRLGLSREEVEKREAAQSPLDRKRTRADLVLDNVGSLADLRAQIEAALLSI